MSVSVYVTFVVFTDCESCTRPISTNPGSMEAGEYGLTRGTCFLACGLVLDAVAGLLWISWCALGGADVFSVFFYVFFFFERTRPVVRMRPSCLLYLSASNSDACGQGVCVLGFKSFLLERLDPHAVQPKLPHFYTLS